MARDAALMDETAPPLPDLAACRRALVADLVRVAARDRWDRALMAVGWVHLAAFLACHAIYQPDVRSDPRHPALWFAEVAALAATLRLALGPAWWRSTPLAGLLARIWGTFLVLAFSVATLNTLTGWDVDWFKLVWGTLSSFGFATTAWLLSPWFLLSAVQMYLTALLMVHFPHQNYLIYGLSWWAALHAIGLVLIARSRAPRP